MMTKITVTFALIFCLNHQSAHAQLGVYKVHSLFIYNFTKHILWKDVDENFTIGVYGSEIALNVMKENLTGKRYFGKEIRVIRVEKISDANQSQLVYMPKSDKAKILNIFEGANKNNVLFVSEDDLIDQGFPISFVLNGTKHRFKVSKKNLAASGLKISTSLLSLAEVVD